MVDHQIPNDDLGDWGESQFRALCSAAGLVANKAERDKMGWDFLVELPPKASMSALPLDQRPNRLGCRVQVKTHWKREDDRFEMTLSAAQRLARDPGPSFILVLTAEASREDEDPKLACCHLIHMLDSNLERVLRRLRESAANPEAGSLNEQKISFSPKIAGEELPPQGRAIRDALVRVCGADAQAYIARKGQQLRDLGYTAGRYQLNTTITANNPDEFVEMMLGLRPVSLEKFDTYDARFGVLLPVNHVPPTTAFKVQFEPRPLTKCIIRIRGTSLTPPAVFHGHIFMPVVPVPDQHMRMLIKAPFITLDLQAGGRTDFNVDGQSLIKAELNLEDWQQYLRLLKILGESELEFDVEGNEPGMKRVTSRLKSTMPQPREPWIASLAEVARRGEALLKLAGARGEATSLAKLNETAEMVGWANARLFEPAAVPPQTFESSGQLPHGIAIADTEFLQADYVVIAGVALGYACRVTMRPEPAGAGLLWRLVATKPERLAIIDKTVEAFKAFVADTQEQTGLKNTMVRDLSAESNDTPDEPANS
jgi:hypothetical protein